MKKFNVCKNWNTVIHGFAVPHGAVYGLYNGTKYVVTTLDWYKDRGVLEVYVYSRETQRWKKRLMDNDFSDFIKMEIELRGLLGTTPKNQLQYKGTFQSQVPTGHKQKITSLKEANKKHWKRADSSDFYRNRAGELEVCDIMTKNIVYI